MKWIAIAGTWHHTNEQVEDDVRSQVRNSMEKGDGIVSGGALGVDFFATEEALEKDPTAKRIKIVLPATLERYIEHYRKRADEGVIQHSQAEKLIALLEAVHAANPSAILENPDDVTIDKETYFKRITQIVSLADELVAFQVNHSAGTQDSIDKAHKKGIPVRLFSYIV